MTQFLEAAIEIAREAGAILRAELDRPKKISYKGEVDIVTESDRRSEELIVTRLRKYFPGHAIVAEEGSGEAAAGAKYCWHVDPLDGTTNFAHGYPCFAVSIGLVEDGEPVAGVVFNPVSDEQPAKAVSAIMPAIIVRKLRHSVPSLASGRCPESPSPRMSQSL